MILRSIRYKRHFLRHIHNVWSNGKLLNHRHNKRIKTLRKSLATQK